MQSKWLKIVVLKVKEKYTVLKLMFQAENNDLRCFLKELVSKRHVGRYCGRQYMKKHKRHINKRC